MPDDSFVQSSFDQATDFFKVGILPELMENWYSHALTYSVVASADTNTDTNKDLDRSSQGNPEVWCFCQQPEHGRMIACDCSECPYNLVSHRLCKSENYTKSKVVLP